MKGYGMWVGLVGLLVLICGREPVTRGVALGIESCLQVVIPSLFPFFVLVNWLLGTELPRLVSRKLGPVMRTVFHLPEAGAVALVLSLLGGYPLGAQTVCQLAQRGQLSPAQGERLLAFCNNTGPAIFFGLVGGLLFPGWVLPLLLYGIHIGSALLTGLLLRPRQLPDRGSAANTPVTPVSPLEAMERAFGSCMRLSMFVVTFRILVELAGLLPCHTLGKVLLAGLLDLPNGLQALQQIKPLPLQFFLCSGMINWAGLCIHLQTRAVTPGLQLIWHLRGKLVQTVLSLLLALPISLVLAGWSPWVLLWLPGLPVLFLFGKTRVEISPRKRYNKIKAG